MVDLKVITTACRLYRQSFWSMLPFGLAIAGLLLLIHLPQLANVKVFLMVLCIPLMMAWIIVCDEINKQKKPNFLDIVSILIEKFPSLIGTWANMLFIPIIIAVVGIALIFCLAYLKLPSIFVTGLFCLLGLIIFAMLVPKWMAMLLIFTDSLDANSSIEQSETLVKKHYLKTFLLIGYGLLYFGLLLTMATWLPFLIPSIKTLDLFWLQGLSALLTGVLGPWFVALWIAHLNALRT